MLRCGGDRSRWIAVVLCVAAAVATPPAQGRPGLSAVFAAAALDAGPPALRWLRREYLPRRREWPPALAVGQPFALHLDARGLRIAATDATLPAATAAVATVTFGDDRHLLCALSADGTEDWFAPADLALPPRLRALLRALGIDAADATHTLDAPIAIGHLLGAVVEGDPRAEPVQLGAALCGEVTWIAWPAAEELRVRGRSDGGLLLPAVLAALATLPPGADPAVAWSEAPATTADPRLRAFTARDGDRAEAARQLVRADASAAVGTLRALLHADDPTRLAAIDALLRLRAADELPRIVAAAAPDLPWASLAAADAVAVLWPQASSSVRQATREALARSDVPAIRALAPNRPRAPAPPPPPRLADEAAAVARMRALFALAIAAFGLYGLWLRERALLRAV